MTEKRQKNLQLPRLALDTLTGLKEAMNDAGLDVSDSEVMEAAVLLMRGLSIEEQAKRIAHLRVEELKAGLERLRAKGVDTTRPPTISHEEREQRRAETRGPGGGIPRK